MPIKHPALPQFRCPQCGGWAFGALVKTIKPFEIECYRCDSDTTGTALSMNDEEYEAYQRGAGLPNREKPCGWRGKYEECFDAS